MPLPQLLGQACAAMPGDGKIIAHLWASMINGEQNVWEKIITEAFSLVEVVRDLVHKHGGDF